jgi:hypothetical protein
MFDEDGDFVDDHDALEFDVHVAPNPMSEKVARFVEWFSTTGDVARLYLELSGDDLEHAAQLYMTMPDAQEAAAAAAATSKRPSTHDGPMNPKNKPGDSSHPGGGSGNPSDSEEVGHRSKNKKGKQRATADDDDEDYKDVRWDDDSDDYGGNDDPFSGISRRAYNFREVLRHNANVDETQESFRDYARRQAQRAGPRGFPERHEKPERDSSALQTQGRRASSDVYGTSGVDRGRLPESNTFSNTNNISAGSSIGSRRHVRTSRTSVRRDSSVGLAANYAEDGPRVSEYRPYLSPSSAITSSNAQMAEQRRQDSTRASRTAIQYSTGYGSDFNEHSSSPSRETGQNYGFASAPGVSEPFGDQESQQTEFVIDTRLEGSLQYVQSTYHGLLPNGYSQSRSTPFPASDALPGPSNLQYPNAAESDGTVQANAPWTGASYYAGRDSNTPMPIAAPYPASYLSAPSVEGSFLDSSAERLDSVAPGVPGSMSGATGQDDTHFTQSAQSAQLSSGSNAFSNATQPPRLQTDITSNLESMDVDSTEDTSPGGVSVDTKQMQDADL